MGNNKNNIINIVELIQQHAVIQPNATAFSFLRDGEHADIEISFQVLDQTAKAIAAQLQQNQLVGERAILLYPPGLDFISAFLGCLYAGVVPVPAYPPRSSQDIQKIQDIIHDASATAILSVSSLIVSLQKLLTASKLQSTKSNIWLDTDNCQLEMGHEWQQPIIHSDMLAFLQYTSGSTGTPKGVMVSHGNLFHNESMIEQAFGHDQQTVVVGWLPFYHDMGLIGNILQPLYLGRPCILMSPLAFLQKPFRWLKAISDYQATTSGGPNFAYEMCVRKITDEQKKSLDLSHWQLAFNGAEPIRSDVLDEFAHAFSDCGFNKTAFYPCYGMAETTLLLTGGNKLEQPRYHCVDKQALEDNKIISVASDESESKTLVSCGSPWSGQKIIIVNPDRLIQCNENEVGEIWVQGPSVTQGYWGKQALTQQQYHAYLRDTDEGPFLRTGDLGYLYQGELFINGRLKDLMIVRGRNHYPEDIEFAVQHSHEALRPGCGAAFSVDIDGKEKIVIVHEVKRQFLQSINLVEVLGNMTQVLTRTHGIKAYAQLLWPGAIPKTSSGKVRRSVCRKKFIAGELKGIDGSYASNVLHRPLHLSTVSTH